VIGAARAAHARDLVWALQQQLDLRALIALVA
jgi:hypothetical protein